LYVKTGDETEFADCVWRLYQDECLWRRISAAGLQLMQSYFSERVASDELKEMLERIGLIHLVGRNHLE